MINIEDLSFGYQRKKLLFDHLSLRLRPGCIPGLLGKNGAGKTTLLKIISGLLFPDKGNIEVTGCFPRDRKPQFLREIYLLPEEFILPSMNTEKYVELFSPFYPRFSHRLFDEYIHEFRLSREQKLSSMSYGQKKKFLLSFGMASNCMLMILDEPTNGLDIPSKSQFRKIIANAVHDERSFIISSHQVRDIENLIDPIIILDEGKIVFCQDCSSITEKLAFSRQKELPVGKNIIFHEETVGGYNLAEENTTGVETRINMELLFNAVLGNRDKISNLFKS